MNANKTSLTLALTAAIGAAGIAQAEGNPFAMQSLSNGYRVAAADKMMDGKCGTGKCGANKTKAKVKDGKCGTGKCGASKVKPEAKAMEGKCGGDKAMEGKCGGDKAKEGQCGGNKGMEGKCGASK